MGTYFHLRTTLFAGFPSLPIVIMSVYIFTNSLGIAPMMFVILGEIFAHDVKDTASSISVIWNHGISVIVTVLFPLISKSFNFGVSFYFFGTVVFISFFFVMAFLPETKGKTFPEIQKKLMKSSKSSSKVIPEPPKFIANELEPSRKHFVNQ